MPVGEGKRGFGDDGKETGNAQVGGGPCVGAGTITGLLFGVVGGYDGYRIGDQGQERLYIIRQRGVKR